MSKKNNDFFKEKKAWSEVKDELLGCYFKPYVQKILHTQKPLVYVDCFAGKGRFDDGKPGSPLIALQIIDECRQSTKMSHVSISANFIDLNYAEELRANLSSYKDVKVFSGKYEDLILDILKNKCNCNIFLYIDPYGIKALNCGLFDAFASQGFNTIELLINLNSFGFIREACNALGAKFANNSIFDDLIEYDSSKFETSEKSIRDLNEIAGGTYWQNIIRDCKNNGQIDGYKAEELFAKEFCMRLHQKYKYVLNLPLRIKKGHRPKYRMIHATNHRDGCILMVDNIYNRWQALRDIQNNRQLSFFEEDYNNEIVDTESIEQKMLAHYALYTTFTSLHETLANFFMEYGAICSTATVKRVLKAWEESKRIFIRREPNKSQTGKLSTFMTEGKNKKVYLRWNHGQN